MAKKKENYLDYIPKHNSLYEWNINERSRVVIKVVNKGLFNRIAQIFFKRPKVSNIELDEFGSFVWEQIDGVRSVYGIGILVKEHFGDKAEPLYERLAKFIGTLRNAGYVVYVNKQKKR